MAKKEEVKNMGRRYLMKKKFYVERNRKGQIKKWVSMGRRYLMKKKFYVERNRKGQIKKWVSKGRSLAMDRKKHTRHKVKSGYGHLGDLVRRSII
jgi:hypothetical protein